jgi:MoaA/NifB/PqqE/SkfB family radical SAM enzyme
MVTRLCNLRCGFCRIWEMDAKGEMTAEEWIRVLERSPRFLWIDLTGGEPTLRPDLREIIAAAIRIHRPWALHFPTNGFLPDRVAPLLEHGRRTRLVVTVSIDGPPALHDRMRGVEGSFERALETLQRARQAPGVTAKAGMTITSENESAIEATVAAIRERIPDFAGEELHINLAQVSGHFYGNSKESFTEATRLSRNAESSTAAATRLRSPSRLAASWLENRYRALLPHFLDSRRCPLPCAAMKASIFIAPDGVVHPCISDARIVGRLRDEEYNLRRLLESETAVRLGKAIAAGDCPHCWTPCEAYPTILEANGLTRRLLRLAR